MLITSKIIVLHKLKYKDNDLIVNCYTKHRGAVSYLIKGALKSSKSNTSKSVYFQPLTQLNVVEDYKPNRSLQFLKEYKTYFLYRTLHQNIYKSAITLFLSEVLHISLKEEEENKELFNFLETSFQYLDTIENFANFHLLFLLKLTRYLGFQPETPNHDAYFFQLEIGTFSAKDEGGKSISGKNLTLLKQFMGINFDALSTIKISAENRQNFLNMLLNYFELHLEGFKKPKSLKVLSQIFG